MHLRLRRWTARLAIAAGAVVAGLLLAEGALHVLSPAPNVSWPYLLGPDDHVAHPATIVTRRALLEDGTYACPEGGRRILCLGDSFTLGYPVSAEEAYPAVLGRRLRGRGIPACVTNVGIGNTGPDQHLRLFEDVVRPRYRAGTVVWSFYWNDVGDNLRLPAYAIEDEALVPLDAASHWLYRRQRIWEGLPLPGGVKRRSQLVRHGLAAWEAAARPRWTPGLEDVEDSVRRIRFAVRRLRALGARDGFEVLIVLVVPQARYLAAQEPETWRDGILLRNHRRLTAALAAEGPFVTVRDEAAMAAAARGVGAPTFGIFADESRRGVQRLGDHHFNAEGYRRMALQIEAALSPR